MISEGGQIVKSIDYDMIIVGAGISGINTAYRVQTGLRNCSYTVLEARSQMGGTWDLFKYPGIRSDSDLHTFGFPWRPWSQDSPIATADSIVKYMKESAAEYGIDKKIQYNHKVVKAEWLSRQQRWVLTVNANGEEQIYRARFMVLGTGYYDYDTPMEAVIPGIENFGGKVVHPQFWPTDLDYANKKIAVIGSGATAITLIPALAQKAEKVTMVQRSPGYIISLPNRGAPKPWYIRMLPTWMQHHAIRYQYLWRGLFYFRWVKNNPDIMRGFLKYAVTSQLPAHIPYDPHFNPRYKPWDQRMCLCPDGDFFQALREKNADVATGVIQSVDKEGITLESGQRIEADLIVTATGLKMKYGGNAEYFVDGEKIDFGEKFLWRGIMVQDMPNMALVMGYAFASWTLGADATAQMVCRVVKHLEKNNMTSAVPRVPEDGSIVQTSTFGLTSTYIMNALHRLPKTADTGPWQARNSYLKDLFDAKFSSIAAGMQYTMAVPKA